MCFSPKRRAIFQHLNFKKWSETVCFLTFWLVNVLLATAACNFSTSQLQKVVRTRSVLYIFTSKCASRHSGVQFFNISTSKSAPNMQCFVHFHFKMCFSPQRRAIFQHLNFKKRSEADVFCTFSLQNVLLATAACNFWFLLWPHDSAPAALTCLLFDSADTRIIEKTQHFATSLTFGADVSSFFTQLHLLSSDSTFFWLYFISSAFHLCFSTLHIVGSLLFKLPSTTPVLLCTTKYYSSTILYYRVLLQYYSVLQSNTPVLFCTTKYCSSTTPVLWCTTKYNSSTTLYYKVLLQYYSSTTPYYKVLIQYYSGLQSTTPVLPCTTKYYSSTILYYKVLLQYYSSTSLYYKVLLQHYSLSKEV